MKRCCGMILGLASLSLLGATGCIIIAGFDGWDRCGTCVWVEGPEERVTFDASGLERVNVRTHNGRVTVVGSAGDDAYVVYKARAGGCSLEEAREAMEALEVFVERRADGEEQIGWRWREPKRRSWSASVNFEIHVPASLDVRARTHNGRVEVAAIEGDVDIETHNGPIEVESRGARLVAQTHNGRIEARFSGRDLSLETHNGRIVADLSECGPIDGRITTHNGSVKVTLGPEASAMVQASTHNGGISCRIPLSEGEMKRHRLRGRIGEGEGALTIQTHNGSVRIAGQES